VPSGKARRHNATLAVALALGGACEAGEPITLPEPPDMSALVEAYNHPTGDLDLGTATALVAAAAESYWLYQESGITELIEDSLHDLRKRIDSADFGGGGGGAGGTGEPPLSVNAVARIERHCRGWGGKNMPSGGPRDGRLELTAVVRKSELARVVWGPADRCFDRMDPIDATYLPFEFFVHGQVSVYLYTDLPATRGGSGFLCQIEGTIANPEQVRKGSFDFRLVSSGLLELRFPLPDGDVIAVVGPRSVDIRGRSTTFRCDPEGGDCVDMSRDREGDRRE
jgi:hypothetical protein